MSTMKGARSAPRRSARPRSFSVTPEQWGAVAAFVLAACLVIAPLIYLTGNLRSAFGPLAYDAADLLYGPVWAAALISLVSAVRERMQAAAPRRMLLALLSAALAAFAMVAVALLRASNRHYHLAHPELGLEGNAFVLVVWTTLIAGVTSVGWHFLGWTLVLTGSAGWTTRLLPRALSGLYVAGGIASMWVYLLPEDEGLAALLAAVISLWQGIWLLRVGRERPRAA
jgi:hypothetical protein